MIKVIDEANGTQLLFDTDTLDYILRGVDMEYKPLWEQVLPKSADPYLEFARNA